jgi:hypothetical protein
MWIFRRRPLLDAETAAWHAANFAWLIEQFGARTRFSETRLILPKPGFFRSDEQGHRRAIDILNQVKSYCGMADWEVDLVADDNPLARPAAPSLALVAPQKYALGTFSLSANKAVITYVPALLQRPQAFIATLAHELAHYLLATAPVQPICDDDEIECLTDLTAIYLGFGVFLANSRFEFAGLQDGMLQGWQMQYCGYLPEADIIHALALFVRAREIDPVPAGIALKPHLRKMLRRALRDHPADHPDIARLRACTDLTEQTEITASRNVERTA